VTKKIMVKTAQYTILLLIIPIIFAGNCGQSPSPEPHKLKTRISKERIDPDKKPDKYAVLISGDTVLDFLFRHRKKYKANLSITYTALIKTGFKKENIYILDFRGKETGNYPVDDFAGKESIRILFEHLTKKIDEKDLFFLYMTGFGKRVAKSIQDNNGVKEIRLSTLVLSGPDLNQSEFSYYIAGLRPKISLFLFDQCYSGGFAEQIERNSYLIVASTDKQMMSRSRVRDSVGYYFMTAYLDKEHSDLDYDDKVSIEEAFEYMINRHTFTIRGMQKPFIKGDLNPSKIWLE